MFDVEEIPDSDSLFYRVHKSFVINGELQAGVFREQGKGHKKGMSTNWNRYSTPLKTQIEINPDITINGVTRLKVKGVRKIQDLKVEHNPIPSNQAHTHVKGIPPKGMEKTRIRLLLLDLADWEIRV